jgi:hypothetical protein
MMTIRFIGVSVLLALLAGCQTPASVQTGPDAEVTHDGLHKVDNSRMKMAWVKPDADLSGYSKVRLVGSGVEYRTVKGADSTQRANSRRTDFPMSEEARNRFEKLVGEVFRDEIGKSKHYTLVEEDGPDVLEVKGALIDVLSNVPPDMIGRGEYYLSKIGEATLLLEIRDSESNEIIARAADRSAIEPAFVVRSNRVTNTSEVRREVRKWAVILREALDRFHDDLDG